MRIFNIGNKGGVPLTITMNAQISVIISTDALYENIFQPAKLLCHHIWPDNGWHTVNVLKSLKEWTLRAYKLLAHLVDFHYRKHHLADIRRTAIFCTKKRPCILSAIVWQRVRALLQNLVELELRKPRGKTCQRRWPYLCCMHSVGGQVLLPTVNKF